MKKKFLLALCALMTLLLPINILTSCNSSPEYEATSSIESVEQEPENIAESLIKEMCSEISNGLCFDMSIQTTMREEASESITTHSLTGKMNNSVVHINGTMFADSNGEAETDGIDIYMERLDNGIATTYINTNDIWIKTTGTRMLTTNFLIPNNIHDVVLREEIEQYEDTDCHVVDATIDVSSFLAALGLNDEYFDILAIPVDITYYFNAKTSKLVAVDAKSREEFGDSLHDAMMEKLGFALDEQITELHIIVKNIDFAFDDTVEIPENVMNDAVMDNGYETVEWLDDFNRLTIKGTKFNIQELMFTDIITLSENNDIDKTIFPKNYIFEYCDIEEFGRLSFGLQNLTDSPLSIEECHIYMVSFYPTADVISEDTTIAEIQFATDTIQDLIGRFGTPSYTQNEGDNAKYVWVNNSLDEFAITVNAETGKIIQVYVYLF